MKKGAQLLFGFIAMGILIGPMIHPEKTLAASSRDEMIARAKQEGTVVLAGSLAEDIATKMPGFRKRYPFINMKFLDMNTKDTINRVVAEAKAGRLSIDWTGTSEDGAEILARQGLLAKQDQPHLKDFLPGSQPPHGLYVGGMVNPRVQGAYNKELIKPAEAPKSWEEMADPKWKGRTMLSRSGEEFPGRLAWLFRKNGKWDWERSFDLFRKLSEQDPVIGRGYAGGAQRVAAGEVAIFWFTPPAVVARLALKGAPLGLIVFPKFFGGLRAWTILKDAPHPAAAWLLVDYLTSPEGQFEWTDGGVGAELQLNLKAKPGKFTQWTIKEGVSFEKLDLVDLSQVEKLYSPEVQKKSEDFYFKILGIR